MTIYKVGSKYFMTLSAAKESFTKSISGRVTLCYQWTMGIYVVSIEINERERENIIIGSIKEVEVLENPEQL